MRRMWILYGSILTGLLILLAVTAREKVEEDWRPEGMYRVFLRPAIRVEHWMGERTGKRGCSRNGYTVLCSPDPAKMDYRSRVEKISALLFCTAAGSVIALLVMASGKWDRHLTEDGQLLRNSCGEGTLQIELEAEAGGQEEILQLEVGERKLTAEELEQMLPEFSALLEEGIKGENESLDQVYTDLHFLTEVEGYPFFIRWESGNYGVIHSDGSVDSAEVPEEGELVQLKATVSYDDWNRTEIFMVRVCEQPENLQQRLMAEIEKNEKAAEYEESFFLPQQAEGVQITWKERVKDNSPVIFLIFLLIGILQFCLPDQEQKKQLEERDRQLRLAYPEFVSKLVLLLGAGLPVRAAVTRMASDYQEKKKNGKFSYAYEELILICREMAGGMTEIQAYEHFGQRCRLPQYRKCAGLLISNQKKGDSSLVRSLQEEAENSFQERKHLAREEGERAGTKLLFPMMMTLAVVMVLILVPACFSFGGI